MRFADILGTSGHGGFPVFATVYGTFSCSGGQEHHFSAVGKTLPWNAASNDVIEWTLEITPLHRLLISLLQNTSQHTQYFTLLLHIISRNMALQDTLRETVQEEVAGITALGKQAVESGAYLYPIKGIFYFVSHRNLWGPLKSRLAPLLGLSIGVIASMFLFT